mgnify:CR=1 FL=1
MDTNLPRGKDAGALETDKLAAVKFLSSGIAHGLNSPLTGILNFLKVYSEEEPPGSERSKELKLMVDACVYMSRIIKNLTYFSSDAKEGFARTSVGEVIESSLHLAERRIITKDIKVVKDFPKELGMVMGSKNQLQHVFLNVIFNAEEAMKSGGEIIIRAKKSEEGNVILEIIDNGVGIPGENIPKLFTPFFTTKKEFGGIGLGLPSVRKILHNHGGGIRIESEEGKGTKVVINLPIII